MVDLLVLQRLAENFQNCADFSGKTSAYWACRKEKSGISATKLAVSKDPRAAFAKGKKNIAICPSHQIVRWERVKISESRTFTRKRGIGAGARGGRSGLHSKRRKAPRRSGRASTENLLRRSRTKHERVNGRKSFPVKSESLIFTTSLTNQI